MGRGSGGRSSGSRSNNFDVNYEFDIYSLRADNQTPTTFTGAIENFRGTFDDTDANEFDFAVDGFPNPDDIDTTLNPLTFNLQTRSIQQNESITLLSGEPAVVDGDNNPVTSGERIEFTLFSDELAELGIDEFTLFIEDEDGTEDGFQITDSNSGTQETFFIDPNQVVVGADAENEAINYIISEDLFSLANGIRVSGGSIDDPEQIVSTEAIELGQADSFEAFVPQAIDDSASTQVNTAVGVDVLDNDNVGIIESFDANSASGGLITQNGDLLEYTPPTDFTGEDTFQYTIDNLGLESTATVTVNVGEAETPVVPPEPVTPEPPTETPLLDGDDVISGDNGDNTLNGGEGNNILYGFGGNDVLLTGGGNDNLQGDNGDDTLSGGGGNDIITGGAGFDLIDGGDGNDTIDGGGQDDSIFGGSGDDLINGGNGNDTLNGGAGNDVLVGDGGSDVFVVNALGGNDTIRDFNFSQDIIGLSDGITLDQITITQGNGAAIINYEGQAIASISGATPEQLGADKFTVI